MSGEHRGVIRTPPPIDKVPTLPRTVSLKETVDPLEIVLGAANACWTAAQKPGGVVDLELATRAAMIAKEALPYTHVRKSAGDDGSGGNEEARAAQQAADARQVRSKLEELVSRRRRASADVA